MLVGVTGGVAAYKSAELVRRLADRGAEVRVAMTRGARAFITPLTLQAVSGHRVHTELLDEAAEAGMGHIELARWADDIVVAPATADLIGRAAAGLADDLLTTLLLATRARLWMAPAMNHVMWAHPAVRANVELLAERGVRMLGPDVGHQACGETGPGRMVEPADIAAAVMERPTGGECRAALEGTRFVVTAGPTLEPLDPVRFLGNRSSGRMGFAVAEALAAAGASVTLIAGPVQRPTPSGVERIDVTTAREMYDAVFAALPADGFVGVAAVADYRPADAAASKIKKNDERLTVDLVRNPDILAEVAASNPRPFTVGFAAETENLDANARAKLERKNLDLIAANQVGEGRGFDRTDNTLRVFSRSDRWDLASGPKTELARKLVELIIQTRERDR
ncbi:bifunctional phosphopantothenoylcysteine decarboxylase/phosphopantothenate--cysteine ligase CoaBC [Halomonas denitrificans]|nr:bifunctional phosphopantothenoylcysteine decarboxylase/phosphopantothenate--cysteine ligase CoaBC [Halomonas denitrificans]